MLTPKAGYYSDLVVTLFSPSHIPYTFKNANLPHPRTKMLVHNIRGRNTNLKKVIKSPRLGTQIVNKFPRGAKGEERREECVETGESSIQTFKGVIF